MERTVFISGSFERHYDGLIRKIKEFEDLGFTVLSPKSMLVTSSMNAPTSLLRQNPAMIRHMQNLMGTLAKVKTDKSIEKSDLFYLYNPDGDIDGKCSLELGLAIGYGKLAFAEETLKDEALCGYCPKATMNHILNQVFISKEKAL